jgi:hypothetical protein
MKAYCKVDFLFPVGGKIYILDWKTGAKNMKHMKQLTGYSMWANYHFGAPPADIVPIAVYLFPQYQEQSIQVTENDIANFVKQVGEEIDLMNEYLVDIDNNIPLPKEKFAPSPSKMCAYCSYREVCEISK